MEGMTEKTMQWLRLLRQSTSKVRLQAMSLISGHILRISWMGYLDILKGLGIFRQR